MLTVSGVRQSLLVWERVRNVTAVATHRGTNDEFSYSDMCERRENSLGESKCVVTSILDLWGSVAAFDAEAAAAGGAYNPATRVAAAERSGSGLTDRFGVPVRASQLLGGVQRDASGNVTGAAIIKHVFQLRTDAYLVDGEDVDPAAEAWEEAMDAAVGTSPGAGYQASLPAVVVVPLTETGRSAEVSDFITNDLALVGAAVGIIIVYVFLQFSECSATGSRAVLALAGIITVGLALGIAYGLGSVTSPSTPVHNVLAFLLFGIGVDDVFVIAGAFSRTSPADPLPLRVAAAMQHAGSSVLLTSLTDALAFGISSTTSLPALSSFTLWALYGIVGAFIMSCTFFTAALTLDARRQAAGRYDCFCCWTNAEAAAAHAATAGNKTPSTTPGTSVTPTPRAASAVYAASADSGAPAGAVSGSNPIHADLEAQSPAPPSEADGWGSRTEWVAGRPRKVCLCVRAGLASETLELAYAPKLLSLPGQVGVGVAFAALIAVAAVGVANLEQEFREEWFVPEDSYLQETFAIRDEYFPSNGFPVWAYARNFHPVDYPDLLGGLADALRNNEYINTETAPILSWNDAFQEFLSASEAAAEAGASGACAFPTASDACPCLEPGLDFAAVPTSKVAYDAAMEAFLCSPLYATWGEEIAFAGGASSGTIALTRVQGFFRLMSSATDEADAMATTIDDVDAAGAAAGLPPPDVFAYSFVFGEWEQYVVVPREAVTNVGLSIACVFVVVSILLADLVVSLLVTVTVGSCLLCILGFMHFWNVSLDGVSVVFLVLAVGISIDYSAHIAHAFLHTHASTKTGRVARALGEMGVSVLNGATSTFLAVVVLSPSGSYIFRVLFRVFFLSSVLGAAHGLMLLPVLLLWFGSPPHPDRHPDAATPEAQKPTHLALRGMT